MFSKYLTLIGRTYIVTFFTVNIFNIVPLDFRNNAWFTQVSMLLVDTASLLLIGLVCLKICSNIKINNFQKKSSSVGPDDNSLLLIREEKAVNFINKISKYLMIFFLILSLFQSYIFINGLKIINNQYSLSYERINNSFIKKKEELKLDDNEIDLTETEFNFLENKKKNFLKRLDKNTSKARFLLFRGNLKVFIMSLIWALSLYKLIKINNIEGEYKFTK